MPVIINEIEVSPAHEPSHEPASEQAAPGPDPTAAARAWHRALVVRTDRLRAD